MKWPIALIILLISYSGFTDEAVFTVKKVNADLSQKLTGSEKFWTNVNPVNIGLTGQMMVNPKPRRGLTQGIQIQSAHDGKYIAFKLTWSDKEKSIGEKLGEFSDAVALQFPVNDNSMPPAFFMGEKGKPVHIYHWKSIYQQDEVLGRKEIKDIYPNMSSDTYPMEFPDHGNLKKPTQAQRDMFNHAKAAGNPQAFPKMAVDELLAEGFSTTTTVEKNESKGFGIWKDGKWEVVITRPLSSNQSKLESGKTSYLCLAVWQGGAKEIGSRKSITANWQFFKLE